MLRRWRASPRLGADKETTKRVSRTASDAGVTLSVFSCLSAGLLGHAWVVTPWRLHRFSQERIPPQALSSDLFAGGLRPDAWDWAGLGLQEVPRYSALLLDSWSRYSWSRLAMGCGASSVQQLSPHEPGPRSARPTATVPDHHDELTKSRLIYSRDTELDRSNALERTAPTMVRPEQYGA